MPGMGDTQVACPGQSASQCIALRHRDPLILLTPEQLHRAADAGKLHFNGVGITLIHLCNLTVKGCLATLACPWRDIGVQHLGVAMKIKGFGQCQGVT